MRALAPQRQSAHSIQRKAIRQLEGKRQRRHILNLDRALSPAIDLRGIPYAVPLIAVLLIMWTFVLGRTAYGRHIYAVGGNTEAARRAGINVDAYLTLLVTGGVLLLAAGVDALARRRRTAGQ